MKARYGSLAFALLFATASAWADDDEPREDPWAYDQDKAEKREKAAEEEKADEREFAVSGQLAISAERVVGISSTSWRVKQTGTDPKGSVTRVHLLLNENSDVRSYSAPRIAFDWFAMDSLSLGGALGYSSEADSESGGASQRQLLVAPRVGYALMFSELIGVWPRVGVTYQQQTITDAKVASKPYVDEITMTRIDEVADTSTTGSTHETSESHKIAVGGKLEYSGGDEKAGGKATVGGTGGYEYQYGTKDTYTSSNTTASAEFNIYADPEAADVVFRSGVPITMMGLDVTHQALLGRRHAEALRATGTRSGRIAAELTDYALDRNMQWSRSTVAAIHDAVAIAHLAIPDLVEVAPYEVTVDTTHGPARGRTVCDGQPYRLARDERTPNADVGIAVDGERFAAILIDAFGRLP